MEAQQPDCLLIEAPEDASSALEYMLHPGLNPPVAILVYDAKELKHASYLPFAEFSPEWQSAQFGLAQGLEVRFMDLPMGVQFHLDEEKEQLALALPDAAREAPEVRDPMGYMARLAGYGDSERWWEATFEQPAHDIDVFETIISLNTALRDELGRIERPMNRLREAYMRKQLRKAIKDGFKNIAVVCGAWHTPALHYLDRFKQKDDNALLKGRKKRKTIATWIPWSYQRLAFQSGYMAGVVSPAYYELLFDKREETVQYWMARVAGLLRGKGFDASAAQAVDAARLAYALAGMRGQSVAGIDAMKEAALAVFAQGSSEPLDLIEQELIIGQRVGEVPDSIPQIPLQQDMEARIRSARLTKLYKSGVPEEKQLDLRKDTHLDTSHLLHQLRILDIPWGRVLEQSDGKLGSFSEYWHLHWQPEYVIRLIQAGMWGNTVEAAANNYLLKKAQDVVKLDELVALAQEALLAGVVRAFNPLVERLEDAAAVTQDVYTLMQALPVLADIQRYGDTRQTDTEAVEALIRHIVPRISIGLPPAVLNIEEEVARDWLRQLVQSNRAVSLLNAESFHKEWNRALGQIANAGPAHPLLKGLSTRILYDKSLLNGDDTANQMRYALSSTTDAEQSALWLEGFLYGSGLLLVHMPALWEILDEWIDDLPEPVFQETLPLLRRSFSTFTPPEREKMLTLSKKGIAQPVPDVSKAPVTSFDQQRAKVVLPTLKLLLGLD
jgi:hypothetical protein